MSIYEITAYFFVYGFLGWCTEVAFAAVKERRFVNRGFLSGPICPVYGFGVVSVAVLLGGVKDRIGDTLYCIGPFSYGAGMGDGIYSGKSISP